jgi:hypothetical protein
MSNTKKAIKKRVPKSKGITIKVNSQFIEEQDKCQSNNKETPPTNIYIFSSEGKLISVDKVKGSGVTEVTLNVLLNDTVTLAIGPDHPDKLYTLNELKRYKPEVQQVKINEKIIDVDFFLPPSRWLCWFLSRCVVPGHVYKDFGNEAPFEDFPIGNATVEVFEVDPFWLWIPKLPEKVIDDLRDVIIELPEPINPPIPPIDPRGLPEPKPFPPVPKPRSLAKKLNADGLHKIKLLKQSPEYKALQLKAKTQSNFEFRQTLLEKPKLILPFLCLYFPHLVKMQKLTEAVTDECGKFSAVFFRGCNNTDKPDLYFKVKQVVPEKGEVTIYEPKPISCYTHWNYQCGTEVTLRSTHPDAVANSNCGGFPSGRYLVFKSVGVKAMSQIFGCGAAATNSQNIGLLDDGKDPGSPFGGGLYFKADFSPSLRNLGIRYYKISVKGPGTNGIFKPLRHKIYRFYNEQSGDTLVRKSYTLGPDKDGHTDLYEIPDTQAPNHSPWVTFAGSMFQNSTSIGYWDSVESSLEEDLLDHAGKYEVQMQLYNASGEEVDIGSGHFYYLSNESGAPADPLEQNKAKDLNLLKVESGEHPSLVFQLHIDNNACAGIIGAPKLGNTPAGECCGTLDYDKNSPPVTLPFTASHPNGFATYDFKVKRSAASLGSLDMDGTATMPGNFNQTGDVSTLMSESLPDTCSEKCQNAAFAEHLHVYAWATNGIHRISGYDAHDFRAFALMKAD